MEDVRQRMRRKRAFHEFEAVSAPSSSTVVVPGITVRLRSAADVISRDEGEDIPSASLRQQVLRQLYHPPVAAAVGGGGNAVDISHLASCPTFLQFGAQSMRVDQETLRALVRHGYTADIDWRRLSMPERLCIIESVLSFPGGTSSFEPSRFINSLAVFNYNDPREVFALYVFIVEGGVRALIQQATVARAQARMITSAAGMASATAAEEEEVAATITDAVTRAYTDAVRHMLDEDNMPQKVEEMLALAYERWQEDDNQVQRALYQEFVQRLGAAVAERCVFASAEPVIQHLQRYAAEVFSPYRHHVIMEPSQQQQQRRNRRITAGELRALRQTRELTEKLHVECSPESTQQRRITQRYQKSLELVDYVAAQTIDFLLQVPGVSIYAIAVQRDNYGEQQVLMTTAVQRVQDVPVNWDILVVTFATTVDACQEASQLISQTLSPWLWQQYVRAGHPVEVAPGTATSLVGPAIVCYRQQAVRVIQVPAYATVRDYLAAQMTGEEGNVPQLSVVRALQRINFATQEWREKWCST